MILQRSCQGTKHGEQSNSMLCDRSVGKKRKKKNKSNKIPHNHPYYLFSTCWDRLKIVETWDVLSKHKHNK